MRRGETGGPHHARIGGPVSPATGWLVYRRTEGVVIPGEIDVGPDLAVTGEARDVLIYMNQPLRYGGRTFYQASFGKGDTLSVLQVVENPGWLLPYISCALVALGLVVHFLAMLFKFLARRPKEA